MGAVGSAVRWVGLGPCKANVLWPVLLSFTGFQRQRRQSGGGAWAARPWVRGERFLAFKVVIYRLWKATLGSQGVGREQPRPAGPQVGGARACKAGNVRGSRQHVRPWGGWDKGPARRKFFGLQACHSASFKGNVRQSGSGPRAARHAGSAQRTLKAGCLAICRRLSPQNPLWFWCFHALGVLGREKRG